MKNRVREEKYIKFYKTFHKKFKNNENLILCSKTLYVCRIETPSVNDGRTNIKGSNEGDHKKHTKYFTNRMKSIVTPEELKRQLSIEPKVYWTKKRVSFI